MTRLAGPAKPPAMSRAPLPPREAYRAQAAAQFASIRNALGLVGTAVVLALALRTFVLEPFDIPSDSMLPTLEAGDNLFVSKWPYGFGRYSLPFALPWITGRLGGTGPHRGDVVVFKTPRDNRTDFIKRVIALPGDRVRMTGGQIELNGGLVPKARAGDFVPAGCQRPACHVARFIETLDGRAYAVLDAVPHGPRDDTPLVTVPAGRYYVAGDNRDDSADSRMTIAEGGVGLIPAANLIGRAELIFFSTAGGRLRIDRIGTRL